MPPLCGGQGTPKTLEVSQGRGSKPRQHRRAAQGGLQGVGGAVYRGCSVWGLQFIEAAVYRDCGVCIEGVHR